MTPPDAPDPAEGRGLYGQDPAAYDAGRPEYPERVWEVLTSRGDLGDGTRVVEIGPGTGRVTRRLLALGAHVTAIEPNRDLAGYLRWNHDGIDQLDVVESTFEDAPLADDAFDLAVAATSFHWVERQPGLRILRRIVKPGGALAIWWMLFDDPTQPDAFDHAVEAIVGRNPGATGDPRRPPFQLDVQAWLTDLRAAGFDAGWSEIIWSDVEMDTRQVVALFATMAVVLRRPPAEQSRVLEEIGTMVERDFGGRVPRRFPTALYTARHLAG